MDTVGKCWSHIIVVAVFRGFRTSIAFSASLIVHRERVSFKELRFALGTLCEIEVVGIEEHICHVQDSCTVGTTLLAPR